MTFARMHYHHSRYTPHRRQEPADRLDRRASKAYVVAHRIDVTALATEIDLHVDYDKCYRFRVDGAVERPHIRLSFDLECFHVPTRNRCLADRLSRATSIPFDFISK